jgi:3-oxoacyl-[acyl-carrier protein] reductase
MELNPEVIQKHMLITGVCGDLGSQLAAYFLEKGFQVFGLDLTAKPPQHLTDQKLFKYVSCDLTDATATTKALEGYIQEFGPIDTVINNVGLIFNSPILNFVDGELVSHSFSEWNKVLDVSLNSAFYVTATCVKHLVKRGLKGTIVNISSVCANGNPGQSAYSAAKAGMNGLSFALAKELGPMGIRVVSIAPGFFDTASTHKAVSEDSIKKLKRNIPLRRLGKVQELAHAVEFVIQNPYYTGTILELDGGLTI